MRVHSKTAAVAASVLTLAGGGGVAWACTGGQGGSGYSGTTGTGTTGTTTTTTTTATTAAAVTHAKRAGHHKHSTRKSARQ